MQINFRIILSGITDWWDKKFFRYFKFNGDTDEKHLEISKKILFKYFYRSGIGSVKAIGIRQNDSKQYIKSTGYLLNTLGMDSLYDKSILKDTINSIESQQDEYFIDKPSEHHLFNLSQLLSGLLDHKCMEPLKSKLFDYLKMHMNNKYMNLCLYSKAALVYCLIKYAKKNSLQMDDMLSLFLKNDNFSSLKILRLNNSFKNAHEASTHEIGYFLYFCLGIYELTNEKKIFDQLVGVFEELHLLFVNRKAFSIYLKPKNHEINVSGYVLLSIGFMNMTRHTNDWRYASAGFFLLDFVKYLQKKNKGFIPNVFPIYTKASPFQYPSWTINYFIWALKLKEESLVWLKKQER